MKIGAKIGLAFGFFTIAIVFSTIITANSIKKSQQHSKTINNTLIPSLEIINSLYSEIINSRILIKSWVNEKNPDTPDKLRLQELHTTIYPEIRDTLFKQSKNWQPEFVELLNYIHISIQDSLFPKHKFIMSSLNSLDSYDNNSIYLKSSFMINNRGEIMLITGKILDKISYLRNSYNDLVNQGRSEMDSSFQQANNLLTRMGISISIIALVVSLFLILSITIPVNKTQKILLSLSKGIIPDENLKERRDEIGKMTKTLNLYINNLKKLLRFSLEIGKGNFDSDFNPLSNEDALGNSLLEMRNELQKASEEESKRKKEDEQRNWASQGIAKFSDILRQNSNDLEELSDNIINNLVKYTNSNQGGFYIINDDDTENIFIELNACYAFSRKKFLEKKIEIGEGLIGRCYQEKERIFLTDIPDDYINITSGLGGENPASLLIVPLIYNNLIYGLLELASFNVYQDFEIEFIERLGESIAATILSVKSNIRTKLLLQNSQEQAEEMHAQEEEMRQNMEELRATQEQSLRRETELQQEVEDLRKRFGEES